MTRKKVTIITFVVNTTFSLLAALTAIYFLVRLSQDVHRPSDKLSFNEFQSLKKLCSAACPGPMNCTEWSDCIFLQPDNCNKLQLLCFYEDNTLFYEVVLTATYSGFNWYDIGRIVTIDILTMILVIGFFLMSAWCFQSIWTESALLLSIMTFHGSTTQKFIKTTNNAQVNQKSRRGVYAAAESQQFSISPPAYTESVTETKDSGRLQ